MEPTRASSPPSAVSVTAEYSTVRNDCEWALDLLVASGLLTHAGVERHRRLLRIADLAERLARSLGTPVGPPALVDAHQVRECLVAEIVALCDRTPHESQFGIIANSLGSEHQFAWRRLSSESLESCLHERLEPLPPDAFGRVLFALAKVLRMGGQAHHDLVAWAAVATAPLPPAPEWFRIHPASRFLQAHIWLDELVAAIETLSAANRRLEHLADRAKRLVQTLVGPITEARARSAVRDRDAVLAALGPRQAIFDEAAAAESLGGLDLASVPPTAGLRVFCSPSDSPRPEPLEQVVDELRASLRDRLRELAEVPDVVQTGVLAALSRSVGLPEDQASELEAWVRADRAEPPTWFERSPQPRYLLAHFWLDDRGFR